MPNLDSDGVLIVYGSERDGDREIYQQNTASGENRRLSERPGRDGYPKFSPEGNRNAYHAIIDDSQTVLRVLDLLSGVVTEFSCAGQRNEAATLIDP